MIHSHAYHQWAWVVFERTASNTRVIMGAECFFGNVFIFAMFSCFLYRDICSSSCSQHLCSTPGDEVHSGQAEQTVLYEGENLSQLEPLVLHCCSPIYRYLDCVDCYHSKKNTATYLGSDLDLVVCEAWGLRLDGVDTHRFGPNTGSCQVSCP